eukprot:SAG31_NODE_15904_length_732_cov_1.924171_1_plen_21_part_10
MTFEEYGCQPETIRTILVKST